MMRPLRIFIFLLLLCFKPEFSEAKVSQHVADSIQQLLNKQELACDQTCPLYASEQAASPTNTIFITALVILGAFWLYKNKKKKIYLIGGFALATVVVGSYFWKSNECANLKYETEYRLTNANKQAVATDTSHASNLSDFENVDDTSKKASLSEFSDFSENTPTVAAKPKVSQINWTDPRLLDPIIAFVLLTVISIGIKYSGFRKLRGLFLLFGVVWFGFYRGGCTCMISSFQDLVLGVASWNFSWILLAWILILVIATYFYGKIWCGWLCHLGGLQEFLHKSTSFNFLSTEKAQRTLKYIRNTVFVLWVLQLVVMKTNLFCQYDPFRTAFNLIATSKIDYILLFVLLTSSVLVYRPFCSMICPVGTLLGWVSQLPGAKRLTINDSCVNCGKCKKICKSDAIFIKDNKTIIDINSCIACGDCLNGCKKDSMKFNRKLLLWDKKN